jgi:hypothetical protein
LINIRNCHILREMHQYSKDPEKKQKRA